MFEDIGHIEGIGTAPAPAERAAGFADIGRTGDVAATPAVPAGPFADIGRVTHIAVDFAGPGSGLGPLTWGQQQIWAAMRATDSAQCLRAVLPLPPGKTAGDLAGELRFFMSRHGSMRSRLIRAAEGGLPHQEVAASGRATLTVLDVPGDGDPALAAEILADHWEAAKFDYAAEWPMRLAAVRHRGLATHVVVVLSHLAADGGGVAAMMEDLADAAERAATAEPGHYGGLGDPDTDVLTNLPTGPSPLDLAERQATPAARRQSDSALTYWERLLRTAQPLTFPAACPGVDADADADADPRYRQLLVEAPAMHRAARVVAARTGGGVAPVLLAAYAVALAGATGANPVLSQIIVGNRFRPGLAAAVHPVSQNGLVLLDVAGITFDTAVERAVRATVLGSKHAYYDPAACDSLVERIGAERGTPVEIGCVFNDRRGGGAGPEAGKSGEAGKADEAGVSGEPGQRVPSAEDIRAAIPLRTMEWGRPLPLFNERLMVTVDHAADSLTLLIEADTHALAAPAVESFVLAMESVLLAAAFDPAAGTGVF